MISSAQSPRTLATLPIAALAVIVSCLFSLLVILQNPLLNDDAYSSYLRAAETFSSDGAKAVLETFGWYNYSILIALLDPVLPGGLIGAAQILNTALYALLTWAFIRLSRELRDSPRVQLFAAVCILAFPLINEMRYFVIRDAGFWAFAFLSLVLLLRFRASGQWRMALGWCLALCAATAFRLEGLLLMLLAPVSLLLSDGVTTQSERKRRFLQLLGILAAVVVSLSIVTLIVGVSLVDLIMFAYRYYLPLLADPFAQLAATATGANEALFTPGNFPGGDNLAFGIVIVLFSDLLTLLLNLVNALSVPLTVLLLFCRFHYGPVALPRGSSRVLPLYIAGATLALVLFVLIMHFLTQRYAALLSLLVLSFVPLLLDDLYASARQHGTVRRFHAIAGFFCFYYLVDSLLSFGYSHRHIEEGIAWTRAELPATAQLRTNDFAIAYHSGRISDYDETPRDIGSVVQASSSGDYLALEIGHNDDTDFLDTNPLLTQLTQFTNERGDAVRIYLYGQERK